MKGQDKIKLLVNYNYKKYTITISSVRYADTVIINKLKIGFASYWLILQNGTWQFIGDMPLCQELKNILVGKVKDYHGLLSGNDTILSGKNEAVDSGSLLNALFSVMSLKKQNS